MVEWQLRLVLGVFISAAKAATQLSPGAIAVSLLGIVMGVLSSETYQLSFALILKPTFLMLTYNMGNSKLRLLNNCVLYGWCGECMLD